MAFLQGRSAKNRAIIDKKKGVSLGPFLINRLLGFLSVMQEKMAHRKAKGEGSWIVDQLSWRRPNQKNVIALMLGLSPQPNSVEIL